MSDRYDTSFGKARTTTRKALAGRHDPELTEEEDRAWRRAFVPGVRVEHRHGRWRGIVIQRPDDVDSLINQDAVWVQLDQEQPAEAYVNRSLKPRRHYSLEHTVMDFQIISPAPSPQEASMPEQDDTLLDKTRATAKETLEDPLVSGLPRLSDSEAVLCRRAFIPGTRVKHVSGWIGTTIPRPRDADPRTPEHVLWVMPDAHQPVKTRQYYVLEAMVRYFVVVGDETPHARTTLPISHALLRRAERVAQGRHEHWLNVYEGDAYPQTWDRLAPSDAERMVRAVATELANLADPASYDAGVRELVRRLQRQGLITPCAPLTGWVLVRDDAGWKVLRWGLEVPVRIPASMSTTTHAEALHDGLTFTDVLET